MEKIGAYAFLLGVIIAVVLGAAVAANVGLTTDVRMGAGAVLVLLGAVVGFLNIHDKETMPFLVSAIALSFGTGAFAALPQIGTYISNILGWVSFFVIPAAAVVAVKTIWDAGSK